MDIKSRNYMSILLFSCYKFTWSGRLHIATRIWVSTQDNFNLINVDVLITCWDIVRRGYTLITSVY